MRLKAPDFWYSNPNDSIAFMLRPLGWLYGFAGRLRRKMTTPFRIPVPVFCVGNLTAGGTGKTPIAIALGDMLKARGLRIAFLSRGYGADIPGAMIVDPREDLAADVGDEPLMLAQHAMTVVSPDRPAGARLAASRGAQVIVMDDGFQNPSLAKDFSLVVFDTYRGFGNGCLIPAGPLRERIDDGLSRANVMLLMGDGTTPPPNFTGMPQLKADLVPLDGEMDRLQEKRVVAFAGIGDPKRFFLTAQKCGVALEATREFPDHHHFSDEDLVDLRDLARRFDAKLLTTEKDWLRLAPTARVDIDVLKVRAKFSTESVQALDPLIDQCLKQFHQSARARR